MRPRCLCGALPGVLGVGAEFFVAMYRWVTMVAETLP
jgi:hypothetical protein